MSHRVSYRVAHARVAVRSAPSTDSQLIDVIRKGNVVETIQRQGNWVRLARPGVAWMLVDGGSVGLGMLLEIVCVQSIRPPALRFAASRAVVITWPSPTDSSGKQCVHHVEIEKQADSELERPLVSHRGAGRVRIG